MINKLVEIGQGHAVRSIFDHSVLDFLVFLTRKKIAGISMSKNNGISKVLIEIVASPVWELVSCS